MAASSTRPDVHTRLAQLTNLVDAYRQRSQTTKLEFALLRQRLQEMQAQSKSIRGRIQQLQKAHVQDTTKLRQLGLMKRNAIKRKQTTDLLKKRRETQQQLQNTQRHTRFERDVRSTLQLANAKKPRR